MNLTDDQLLRQRLHEEFGALEISPAPVLRVTGRGRGVRARRRVLAAGLVVLAVLGVVAAGRLSKTATGSTVTLNAPNPAAPGGVFASGTADGKRWTLAVRNIAAAGSHRCVPAVMFNGRDGDVLFKAAGESRPSAIPRCWRRSPASPAPARFFTRVTPGAPAWLPPSRAARRSPPERCGSRPAASRWTWPASPSRARGTD